MPPWRSSTPGATACRVIADRRDRAGRCREAPAVDRLDPHRARPGRARARLHQMGRPAGLAGRRARSDLCARAWIAQTAPKGPVYVNLDAGMQEEPLDAAAAAARCARAIVPAGHAPALRGADREARRRSCATRSSPLILAGRVSRDADGLGRARRARRAAQRARPHRSEDRRGVSDRPSAACRRARHLRRCPKRARRSREADVIAQPRLGRSRRHAAALRSATRAAADDHPGLAGPSRCTTAGAWITRRCRRSTSCWPPIPTNVVPICSTALGIARAAAGASARARAVPPVEPAARATGGPLDVAHLASGPARSRAASATLSLHPPAARLGRRLRGTSAHPLDFLGSDGGGGIGGGPGISVGAALALQRHGPAADLHLRRRRFPDGRDRDLDRGALPHPAAAASSPTTSSFFNDEVHQERVARMRGRPVENKWIGQRIADPEIDLARIARAQGALGIGPVTTCRPLVAAFREALAHVEAGGVAVVDVHHRARLHAGDGRLAHQAPRDGEEMSKLQLSFAIGDYDRNRPLIDGAVQIDGVDPVVMTLSPEEMFFRAMRHEAFDVCEFSLSQLRAAHRARRLPVCRHSGFPVARVSPHVDHRAHRSRHHDAAGSEGQARRHARMAAHRQCLDARAARGRVRRQAVGHPLGARRARGAGPAGKGQDQAAAGRRRSRTSGPTQTLNEMLHAGEIDAFMGPRAPTASRRRTRSSAGCSRIRRGGDGLLRAHEDLPDHASDRRAAVDRRGASVAADGRAEGVRTLEARPRSSCRHVGHQGDAALRRGAAPPRACVMGEDFWPYGVAANRHVLETLRQASPRAGHLGASVAVDELFHPGTLEEFKI